MKKLIFISGAAGMVGSNLINQYIGKDLIIVAVDNFTLGRKTFIKKYLKKKNFYFFNFDLSTSLFNKKIKGILKKNKLTEVWLLAANSDIQKGIRNPNVDLKNTFLTTFKTLNNINLVSKMNTVYNIQYWILG